MRLLPLLCATGLFLVFPVHAGVLINEIMYHPVERPAFDAAGDPVLDLTEDVHEFIELKNTGSTAVSLAGWRLRGAADYDFPAGASIPAQGFAVVAKFPARLESIAAYALPAGSVFGPWSGGLQNSGDTIRLETVSGAVADAVAYSSSKRPTDQGIAEAFRHTVGPEPRRLILRSGSRNSVPEGVDKVHSSLA